MLAGFRAEVGGMVGMGEIGLEPLICGAEGMSLDSISLRPSHMESMGGGGLEDSRDGCKD